ncbi:MAG: hypothetical protein NTW50_05045 [Candidatus Berkelbacteria bacterium]|nr:hypothetical protein [Candidatus Berkelbacteria bacterium]
MNEREPICLLLLKCIPGLIVLPVIAILLLLASPFLKPYDSVKDMQYSKKIPAPQK